MYSIRHTTSLTHHFMTQLYYQVLLIGESKYNVQIYLFKEYWIV